LTPQITTMVTKTWFFWYMVVKCVSQLCKAGALPFTVSI
jgi:hypothetical protein